MRSLFAYVLHYGYIDGRCGGSSSTSAGVNGVSRMRGCRTDLQMWNSDRSDWHGRNIQRPAGSTVTFSVGGSLCTGASSALMTPVSCAQVTNPSATLSTPSVVAVAQFSCSRISTSHHPRRFDYYLSELKQPHH